MCPVTFLISAVALSIVAQGARVWEPDFFQFLRTGTRRPAARVWVRSVDICGRERCILRRLKQGRTRRARGSDRCCYYHRLLPRPFCTAIVPLHVKVDSKSSHASALIGRDAAPARGPHRSAGRSRGGEVRARCRPRPHAPDARPLPSNSDRTATRREQVIRAGPPAPPLVHVTEGMGCVTE